VGGGCLLGEVDYETTSFGFVTPLGTYSNTGIGLALHGGFGYLSPYYGYAVDNILEADIALSDGKVLRVSKDKHPDLFWGICGAATHLGVVIQFKTQLHPMPTTCYGGLVLWDTKYTKELLSLYQKNLLNGTYGTDSKRLYLFAAIMNFPPLGDPTKHYCAVMFAYSGSDGKGKECVDEFRAIGAPILDTTTDITYLQLQRHIDTAFPAHCYAYTCSRFLKGNFTEEFLDEVHKLCTNKPDGVLFALNDVRGGGPSTKKEMNDNAFIGRNFNWEINITSVFLQLDEKSTAQRDADKKWIQEAHHRLENFEFNRFNYINHGDVESWINGQNLGPNEERVLKLKEQYDPIKLFLSLREKYA